MSLLPTTVSNEKDPVQSHEPQHPDDDDDKPQVSEINDVSEEALSEQQTTVWTWKSLIASIALSGLYVGSQIPIYFVGGELTFIVAEIGHADAGSWITVAYTLPLAAVAPFTGYLQDLVGRRYVTLVGGVFLMLGCLLVALAHTFRQCLVGMCFSGAGAAVCELTALAGVAELVPVKKRGLHLAWVTGFVLPFTPYVLYCQLLSTHSTWRWGLWICLIWCGLWWIITAVFYWPQSQTRARGAAAKQLLKQIDYVGGFLSIVGTAILLVALQAGGYSHSWRSAYVLVQLLVGVALLVAFVIWEWRFCADPMIPHDMFSGQRIVAKMYALAFIAGMNFYAMLNFFPLEYKEMFDPDPVRVGLRALPAGIGTTVGAVLGNALLTWFKGHNKSILIIGCCIMTAFSGALATVTPDREGLSIALGTMTGLGVGLVLVPSITVAVTVTPDHTIATCVALSLSVRAIGGAIGSAVYYNVFLNKTTAYIPQYVAQYATKAGLPASSLKSFVEAFLADPTTTQGIPGVTEKVIQAASIGTRWAYGESLEYVWLSSIAFGGCAVLLCLTVEDISKYMTSRVAARLV